MAHRLMLYLHSNSHPYGSMGLSDILLMLLGALVAALMPHNF